LADLLDGEGHPRAHLVVEVGVAAGRFGVEVDRRMEKRAAGRDHELLSARAEALERFERVLQVVDPDVAAVDDAGEEPLILETALLRDELSVMAAPMLMDGLIELISVDGAGEVEPDALD